MPMATGEFSKGLILDCNLKHPVNIGYILEVNQVYDTVLICPVPQGH